MLLTKFVNNNAKNVNIRHIILELHCDYNLYTFYKEDNNFRFQLKSVNELVNKLGKLIIVYIKNLQYAQNFIK